MNNQHLDVYQVKLWSGGDQWIYFLKEFYITVICIRLQIITTRGCARYTSQKMGKRGWGWGIVIILFLHIWYIQLWCLSLTNTLLTSVHHPTTTHMPSSSSNHTHTGMLIWKLKCQKQDRYRFGLFLYMYFCWVHLIIMNGESVGCQKMVWLMCNNQQ